MNRIGRDAKKTLSLLNIDKWNGSPSVPVEPNG